MHVFDLDHTLLSVNSSFKFGSYLYKHKQMPFPKMAHAVMCYALHCSGFYSISQMQQKIFRSFFKGTSASFIQLQVKRFLEMNLHQMLFQPAIAALNDAKQSGQYILILSSSPSFLVQPIAEFLQADGWCGTEYGIDKNHHFIDIKTLFLGEDKARYMCHKAEEWKVPKEKIIAYADSILDLPMLRAAGGVVCVKPDHKLRKLAKQQQWRCIE